MRRLPAILALAAALPAVPALAGEITGQGGHAAAGTVDLVETPAGRVLRFGADFELAPGGQPEVLLGQPGGAVVLGPLPAREGPQDIPLPAGVDPEAAGEVWIRCLIDLRVMAAAPVE